MSVIVPDQPWPPPDDWEPPQPEPQDPNEEPPWTGPPELKGEVQDIARDYA